MAWCSWIRFVLITVYNLCYWFITQLAERAPAHVHVA